MHARLVQIGDELALPIDQAMLDSIGAGPGTSFRITIVGSSIELTPERDPERDRKLREALDRLNRRFGDDLRRLAD
ncbi:MAG: hypothetical protein WC718_07390 [Phycisphaerales bacterium]|jgi:hypothetical protein